MFFLGIDIGKFSSVAILIDDKGTIIDKSLKFSNSTEGANSLFDLINSYVFKTSLKDLEIQINSIYESFNCYLTTIPGISNTLAAIILSEIGDINKFSSPSKLVAFAGIDPSINQSGGFNGTENLMSKRGSPFLRRALFLAAFVAENNNLSLKTYYQKKIAEGKHHYVATRCCCSKAHIYYLWSS